MTEDVLKALRQSSKGKLNYDPFWIQDGRWPEILGAAETIELDSRLLPLRFDEEDDSVRSSEELEPTPESVAELTERDPEPAEDDTQDLKIFLDTSGTDLSLLEYEEERLNSVRVSQPSFMSALLQARHEAPSGPHVTQPAAHRKKEAARRKVQIKER